MDRPPVHGIDADAQTRCVHYHSPRDIVAIRMRCCGAYYCCIDCHRALADHPSEPWPKHRFGEKSVLCGACGHELTIDEYLHCDSRCPHCDAAFNPGCANHYPYYFDV